MEPVEYKLLEKLRAEQKFEIATRALCDIAKEMAFQELRLLELVDRFEQLLRKAEARSWERVIRQRMEELGKDGNRTESKRAAYKRTN
ncbi:MAG: hypothetical protein GTO24_20885 [candidate division Zixibacteria bacterium]|nr:hypothetical protein [candidate division Zixibacteria bacterium]